MHARSGVPERVHAKAAPSDECVCCVAVPRAAVSCHVCAPCLARSLTRRRVGRARASGIPSDHFQVTNIVISPDNPQAGDTLTLVLSGTVDETVSSGSVSLSFLWGHIAVAQKDMPLCDGLGTLGVKCPLAPGPLQTKSSFVLPQDIPSGSYTAKLRAVDQNGEEVVCVTTQLGFA